jgi:predicted ATPase/SAM-dependent methyltransferase
VDSRSPVSRMSNWTLDLLVRCRLSILEARLITMSKINIIAGQNGCGKSQLLAIMHSHFNTGSDKYLQSEGYRTYFSAERSQVAINGPGRIHYIRPARVIAKDRDEKIRGAYSFDDLHEFVFTERYSKFRKSLSKLAYEAAHYSRQPTPEANEGVRQLKRKLLESVTDAFESLFPGRSLKFAVDDVKRTVTLLAQRTDMPFVRPDDSRFGPNLNVPFATLSEGELNALFLVFELVYHAVEAPTPVLFLVDEIENHLHPDLQLKAIELLQSLLPANAMILATTHSPLIVTAVPPASRILMIHSADMYARHLSNQLLFGKNADIGLLLHELYGASSALAGHYLMTDYHRMARVEAVSYAEECLREAGAKSDSLETDPQRIFLTALVQGCIGNGTAVRVLDIGAGTGRLFRGLCEDFSPSPAVTVVIDAVEPRSEYRQVIESLSTPSDSPIARGVIFANVAAVPADVSYDIVLLHNVVHELWAMDLVQVLHRCAMLLRSGGALNVLEMSILPHGEQRFFVYSEAALCRLLEAIGFVTVGAHRRSRSGVPLYEITARRNKHPVPDIETIQRATLVAIEASLDATIQSFAQESERKGSAMALAFYAMNLAYGQLLCLDPGLKAATEVPADRS